MSESVTLPWMLIRQDEDGGRYRVGRYATLWEAQSLAERLTARGTSTDAAGAAPAGTRTATPTPAVVSPSDGSRVGAQRAGGGDGEGGMVAERARGRRYLVERTGHPGGSEG